MLELHTTSPVGTDKDNKSLGKRVCITNVSVPPTPLAGLGVLRRLGLYRGI